MVDVVDLRGDVLLLLLVGLGLALSLGCRLGLEEGAVIAGKA